MPRARICTLPWLMVIAFLVSCRATTPEPTAIPTAIPVTPTPEPTATEEHADWDLLFISDGTGWGVPRKYAANIERDTGKTVMIHNYSSANLYIEDVLGALQGDPELLEHPTVRSLIDTIPEAEVMVIFIPPGKVSSDLTGQMDNCILYRHGLPPDNCTPEAHESYVENLKEVYAHLFSLRDGQPTIIRTYDLYNPVLKGWREYDMEEECLHCLEVFNSALRKAADAYNIPLVSLHDAFNGPAHDEEVDAKYIGRTRYLPSPEGKQLIADLLSETGYEPVAP